MDVKVLKGARDLKKRCMYRGDSPPNLRCPNENIIGRLLLLSRHCPNYFSRKTPEI